MAGPVFKGRLPVRSNARTGRAANAVARLSTCVQAVRRPPSRGGQAPSDTVIAVSMFGSAPRGWPSVSMLQADVPAAKAGGRETPRSTA